MRMFSRLLVLATLSAVVPALCGCTNFDPDNLDVFHLNEKKKLPGERKDLFPEGVPGVTQGIPPEYMKGNQPPPETAQALQAPATSSEQGKAAEEAGPDKKAAATEPEPEPKPKPKRAAKPRTASQQPAPTSSQPQQQMAPWPQQAPQQAQSPWPAQGQAAPAPWSSSPQPGSFSR